jgi:2-oxo-4-hydroxy-4-carboxy-5-ureidoimidazoline decarboxylase
MVITALLTAPLAAGESDGMSADELARFNALPRLAAREALLACCNSPTWADRMAAGRPYSSARDAVRQSSAIVAMLGVADLEEALSGHPRIGERADGHAQSAQWSRSEQSAAATSDESIRRELAAANAEYERRFGHVYLVSASGRSAADLLKILNTRLANTPAREWQVVRGELQKINEVRLVKMLAGTR